MKNEEWETLKPNIKENIFINSVTCTERIIELLPLIKEYNAKVIALPIKDKVPQSLKEREENALIICDILKKENINLNNIFFDILVQPIATDPDSGPLTIDTLKLFKKMGLKTTCGLSNVSFGLPQRKMVNSYFLSILMANGLDSVICDITDINIQRATKITDMLTGEDECIDYVKVNNIKIALFNYTYGLNGFTVPEDEYYMVDLFFCQQLFY